MIHSFIPLIFSYRSFNILSIGILSVMSFCQLAMCDHSKYASECASGGFTPCRHQDHLQGENSHITYSVRDDDYLMNETRRKATTGTACPISGRRSVICPVTQTRLDIPSLYLPNHGPPGRGVSWWPAFRPQSNQYAYMYDCRHVRTHSSNELLMLGPPQGTGGGGNVTITQSKMEKY